MAALYGQGSLGVVFSVMAAEISVLQSSQVPPKKLDGGGLDHVRVVLAWSVVLLS